MIVIASQNGAIGIQEAMQVMRAGGTAVDAVEAGIRRVEANPDDHSVGLGGYPNLIGEVELDAAIMDGCDRTAGAVGALRNYLYAISVARQVMEQLPHSFLVGEGAGRFAAEIGAQAAELRTEEALQVWREQLLDAMGEAELERVAELRGLCRWVACASDPARAGGTVNFLALDDRGELAAGVSTSGWAWKFPGRLGDSPVVGAGLYADSRFGAAACTGMGEMAIRAGTARCLVLHVQNGASLAAAGRAAMQDLDELGGRYLAQLSFLLLTPDGQHAGFSNAPDDPYIYLDETMAEPAEVERVVIPTHMCWEGET